MNPSPATMPAEPKRNFFQTAVHNFFALYLGVTPPSRGKEALYAAIIFGAILFLIAIGFVIVRMFLA